MLLCSIRLDPFALDVPFHHLWLKDSGLVEEGLLCAVMTIISGVDLGSAIERGPVKEKTAGFPGFIRSGF